LKSGNDEQKSQETKEARMQLKSSAFSDGAVIPRRFTCDGEDISPPFEWTGVPAGTRSFVMTCDDADAPGGTWWHWAAHDIPADQHSFAEGAIAPGAKSAIKQAINDFGRTGYGGPCPPRGHGPHRYRFRVFALSVDRLPLKQKSGCRDVEREARRHTLAEASLIALYER
jgi:Raf kinase inhibitor-like YbhB/YbcL family protein